MGNELAVVQQREARLAIPTPEFSNEQIRILGETVAKGCDQNELAFFLQVAKLKRLDPFSGQIHVVKRWDSMAGKEKMTVQTGIDGYRVIAARTNDLAGIEDPEYDSEDNEHPNWAKVTVYRYGRSDEKVPYRATARWGEYVQLKKDGTPNRMWKEKPFLMLGKVAEALALRKAFPDELSGMYTNEEMEQADSEGRVTPESVAKPPVSMPRSTDEKKPEPAKVQQGKAETTNAPAVQQAGQNPQAPEEISGEITDVRPGKGAQEGALFLIVNGKIVCIPKEKVDAEMVKGAKVLVTAYRKNNKAGDTYLASAVELVVPPVEDGIIDAEVSDSPKEAPLTPEMSQLAADLFGENKPKGQTTTEPEPEATKPGTAGMARAKRLHTLITQNSRNTGFTEDHLKRYLATQRIEHARDLVVPPKGSDAFNAYEYACSMAVGEIDWHDVLED